MKKKLLFAFIAIVTCVLLTGCGKKVYHLNETATVKSTNVKITVLSIEDYTIDNSDYALANGEYTRVKLTIENNGDSEFGYSSIEFKLGDSLIAIATLAEKDVLPVIVPVKEKMTGYLYFEKTDSKILTYTAPLDVNVEQETITFDLSK